MKIGSATDHGGYVLKEPMLPETMGVYRAHGKPSLQLEKGAMKAHRVLESLREAGIDLDAMTQQLENEGVVEFIKALEQLIAALHEKSAASAQKSVKP
jgi:transaldolase/transaldolase/glucose-6-phosphate isomerase